MSDLLVTRGAEISPCGLFRYLLWRQWDSTTSPLGWIMLNPSTADADIDDATIRICMGRAQRMGLGGIIVANAFPFRATKPSDLKLASDLGHEHSKNWAAIGAAFQCKTTIAAWGDDGRLMAQDQKIRRAAAANRVHLFHLGLTKAGQPRHPLRIGYAVAPILWVA
jgi:hypothetical protein